MASATSSQPTNLVKPWLPKAEPQILLLKQCNIVNVSNGTIWENYQIALKDGMIIIIASGDAKMEPPPGTKVVNLEGSYVCPGLIDCHVHVAATPGEMDLGKVIAMPEQEKLLRMTFVCRDMLSRGFTTVRDCGGAPYALKQAVNEWLVPGPRLFISGHALSQTGGHGDFRSPHDHAECASGFVSGIGRVCDGVPECLRVTRDEMRCGADFIKIMASGGVASPTDKLESTQFSPEEIQAIVSVAKQAGTYVTCHAYTPDAIRNAIENGVKGVEHGNLIDRPTAKLMAEKGVYLTQTLVTYQTLADKTLPQFLPADSVKKNETVLKTGLEALKIAKEEGVTICYGSDLLGPLGFNQSKGLSICSEVLSPLEVLQSATVNAAKMLGLDDLGKIEANFKADLLVLNSNPLDNISSLADDSNILAVLKEGRVCWSKVHELPGLLDGFANL